MGEWLNVCLADSNILSVRRWQSLGCWGFDDVHDICQFACTATAFAFITFPKVLRLKMHWSNVEKFSGNLKVEILPQFCEACIAFNISSVPEISQQIRGRWHQLYFLGKLAPIPHNPNCNHCSSAKLPTVHFIPQLPGSVWYWSAI